MRRLCLLSRDPATPAVTARRRPAIAPRKCRKATDPQRQNERASRHETPRSLLFKRCSRVPVASASADRRRRRAARHTINSLFLVCTCWTGEVALLAVLPAVTGSAVVTRLLEERSIYSGRIHAGRAVAK